ncbi:MAG: penicillin-binding protein 2 [Actinomycetota bacterium]|nr:penicillin-binding protein 2 [Actinomycetota bacterium]
MTDGARTRPWQRLGLSDRALAAIAALVGVLVVIVVIVVRSVGGPSASDALDGYLGALEAEDPEAAATFTNGEPELVADTIQANIDGLDGASAEAEVEEVSESGSSATATVLMSWDVPEQGPFEYSNDTITLTLAEGEWLVDWSSRVIHPGLREDGFRLGTVEAFEDRAPILDRDGEELVSLGSVVDVGVLPSETDDAEATVSAIAGLTEVDPATLTKAIDAAKEDAVVPAITLREEDFAPVETELRAVPGIQLAGRETPLTPTRDFARALLGTVGPATAEQVKKSDGELDADDVVGQSGLSAAFEDQLAGEPERSVVIRNADAEPVETLETQPGEPGEPLETTLSSEVQAAAEEALADVDGAAALVALDPKRGDILAVANRPTEAGLNIAFTGQYPPGSTFKVVTTTALLETGLETTETVDCPESINAGGREFVNFEGSAAGAVPFSTDFAQSCNTAFVSLADKLEPTDLRDTAELFGLGIDPGLELDAFGGDVPPAKDEVEEAAAMIGQARILASPLAMAGVAATVQSGEWHRPRLISTDPEKTGEPLPPEDAEELRTLMRSVVTSGTGTALAAVPGEPIGKSGTAEFGTADPPKTHAWFIAAREDVAVAVLVEEGTSGGEVAAPIAASFLTALPLEP